MSKRRVLAVSFSIFGAFALGMFGSGISATADPPDVLNVTVRGPLGGSPDDIAVEGMTFDDANTAFDLAVAADPAAATLPIAPTGFTEVTATNASLYRDATSRTMVVDGNTTLLGQATEMLVTMVWDSDTDTDPDTAVLFKFGAVTLHDLIPSFNAFPVSLSSSWIGLTTDAQTIDPADLPTGVQDYLDDPIDLVVSGVAFRGMLDVTGTPVGDALNHVGLEGVARLDGTLASSAAAVEDGAEASTVVGLHLSATFNATGTPDSLPEWFTPTDEWSLSLDADSAGKVSVELGGSADVKVDDVTYPIEASIGFEYDGTDATFKLTGSLGEVDNLFGADWLDLTSLDVDVSIGTGGFSGSLKGVVNLEDLTGQPNTHADAEIALDASADGASGHVQLSTNATVNLNDVATAIGATSVPSAFQVDIDGFGLYVGFEHETASTKLTVAVTTGINLTINSAHIDSDILFRLVVGGGEPAKFLFEVKPDDAAPDVTVGQLVGQDFGDADVVLPKFTISISNNDWDIPAADLDGPTADYLGPGEDLDFSAGFRIKADIAIPQALRDALGKIGLDTDGNLVLTGELPILGGTTLGLTVEFPTIVGSEGQPFREGNLSLFIKKVGLVNPVIKMGVEGKAKIGVPRTEDSACSSPYAGACTDVLEFDVKATLEVGAGTGVGFELSGGLTTVTPWHEPFGVSGLDIKELRIKVGVHAGGPDPAPTVTVGMLGVLKVNDTDLTLSFLIGFTPAPPFVKPLGFTFMTKHGFGIEDLTKLHEMVSGTTIPAGVLPTGLRVQNVVASFGIVDDNELCIRSGFFMTAELHYGGTPPDGTMDDCHTAPPISPPALTASCSNSSSCLAAILIDVDTGVASGTPHFNAAGFFAATDLGPLHFDPTRIELELSPTKQRLFVSAGAHLDDPFDTSGDPDTWASGSVVLDFTFTHIKFVGELNLGDGKALHVKVTGEGSLSLSDPAFSVDVEFHSDILDNVVNDVKDGFNSFIGAVNDFGDLLSQAKNDNPNLWRNLLVIMKQYGAAPQWLQDVVDKFASVEDTLEGINKVFTDAGLPPPILTLAIRDIVLHGITIPGFPGIPGATVPLRGCAIPNPFGGCILEVDLGDPICLGVVQGGSCWLVPPTTAWTIPGLCSASGFAGPFHDFLCTDLSQPKVVANLFKDDLHNELGVDLGNKDPQNVLETLDPLLNGSGIQANCGHATVDYGDNTVSDTELTMNIGGKTVVFDTPLDLVNGTFDSNNNALKEAVEALLGDGDPTPGNCTTTSVSTAAVSSSITLGVTPLSLNEGGSVTASGVATVPGATNVTLDWGDGTSSTPAIGTAGAYTANHTYTDDLGPGPVTNYVVEAKAGTASDTELVTVLNVAPTVTASLGAASVNEGGTASVVVNFTDPGADTHNVELRWSDGAVQSVDLTNGERQHTFMRTIEDDNPTATASDALDVVVNVRDDDGGLGTTTKRLTVNNVNPGSITLRPVSVLNGTPTYDTSGALVVNEGQFVLWEVDLSDVGVRDFETVGINWGDGTSDTRTVPATGLATRTFQITHYYIDDNPTATASDTYNAVLTVTDDDTGSGMRTVPVVVHDLAPVITSVTPSTTTPREEQQVSLTVNWTDLGAADSHVVRVDWKDGTVNTYNVAAPSPAAIARSLVVTHTYDDENPTATSHDNYPVDVRVTDDDTLHADTVVNLDVTNVAPTITSFTVSSLSHNENATAVTLNLKFSDPSVMDSHTVTIDWGLGWTAGNSNDLTVDDEDARTTVVPIAAPGHSATTAQVNALRSVTATNRYGDNGVYTIGVRVVDDDTGLATSSWTLTVLNVAPTHAIKDTVADGATATAGGQTFLGRTGDLMSVSDHATDPGSDDLTFDWTYGDGGAVSHPRLVNVPYPGADALPSPQVAPRDVTDTITHTYTNACLYGISVKVTDDDGGNGGFDYVAVVIQRRRAAGDTIQRNFGQWKDAITSGAFTTAQVNCYLDIAGHLSSVLFGASEKAGVPWSPKVGTEDLTVKDAYGVPVVLTREPGKGDTKLRQEQIKLERALLSAWMNYADGKWQWNTLIEDTNGDGRLDTSFSQVMRAVELVRTTSNSDKAVADARQRLWQLGIS